MMTPTSGLLLQMMTLLAIDPETLGQGDPLYLELISAPFTPSPDLEYDDITYLDQARYQFVQFSGEENEVFLDPGNGDIAIFGKQTGSNLWGVFRGNDDWSGTETLYGVAYGDGPNERLFATAAFPEAVVWNAPRQFILVNLELVRLNMNRFA